MEGQSAVVFRSEDRSIDTHSAYFHVDFSKKRGSVQATLCSFIAVSYTHLTLPTKSLV